MTAPKLPTSKAKTAYGLLSEIAALALQEPKRMRMSTWLNRKAKRMYGADATPACGTVGCIAGWGAILAGTKREQRALERSGAEFDGVIPWKAIGARIFGLNESDALQLFKADGIAGNQGTLQHARNVVKCIRRFQQQHAAQLKAKRV